MEHGSSKFGRNRRATKIGSEGPINQKWVLGSFSYFSLSMLSSKVSSFVRSSRARLFSSSLKSISIKGFFAAKNYAIVGASTKPGTMGNIICENYKRVYKGETFYINPKGAVLISMSCLGGELFGQPIYKTPMDVPKSIEAAVVVISAKFAVSVRRVHEEGSQVHHHDSRRLQRNEDGGGSSEAGRFRSLR